MNLLKRVREYGERTPDRVAVRCGEAFLTYGELWTYSDSLAAWLLEREKGEKHPVAVYGHKNPWMLVCFLACVKSGRGYCPIDISVPENRVEMILNALLSGLVLTTEPLSAGAGEKRVMTLEELQKAAGVSGEAEKGSGVPGETEKEASVPEGPQKAAEVPARRRLPGEEDWVRGDETYYIIFTSGSTGTPKGVQISADCLNHYLDWSVALGSGPEEKQGQVFLNQAPFSFDLSVMDLYTCLASGGTLYCLEKRVQSDYRLLMEALSRSEAKVWVSTPSFAEVCLSERSFSQELLPRLDLFLFCGETLANRTVKKLWQRFPGAKIMNTYGPTESTVAVTGVLVTPKLNETENPLPVGRAKPGTRIEIWDQEGNAVPDGEKGEIIILGDTVSTGYYRQPELTQKAFFQNAGDKTGGIARSAEAAYESGSQPGRDSRRDAPESVRGYHTGDKGYLRDGMLYYCGRIDLQIKLRGYRVELEDIESNLRRLPGVEHALVLPNTRNGKVTSLTAYLVEQRQPEDQRAEAGRLKEELAAFLPDYMVPKKFVFLDQMPMTSNGKADRRKLGGREE